MPYQTEQCGPIFDSDYLTEIESMRLEQMASSPSPSLSLTVVDVYDVASSIGKEFEKVIDNFGPEAVTELMPKVINVLEHLEVLAAKNQKENSEIFELQFAVERLQAEKTAKAHDREQYERELEQIEDSWRKETRELTHAITKLQEENRRLHHIAAKLKDEDEEKHEDNTMQLVAELKDTVMKQRDNMRTLSRELTQKSVDLEAMQSQLESLAKLNADIRRRTTQTQLQAQTLITDKAELETQIRDKEQQIQLIKEQLHQDSQERHSSLTDEEYEKLEEKLKQQGKIVIDAHDPNRPRFTLNELRDVLQERNELKSRLVQVEQDLHHYRQEKKSEPIDFDAPVHGPINKEPDEKLYPGCKQESGIRKFFNFLLSPGKTKSQYKKKPPKREKYQMVPAHKC